jgi:hypothetical protein
MFGGCRNFFLAAFFWCCIFMVVAYTISVEPKAKETGGTTSETITMRMNGKNKLTKQEENERREQHIQLFHEGLAIYCPFCRDEAGEAGYTYCHRCFVECDLERRGWDTNG